MLLLYSIFNKLGAMTFSLSIDLDHLTMLTEQRSIGTKLLHVYVFYYFILKAFLIACHYKTYIMSILFLLLMSIYAILTCFVLC